MGFIAYIKKYKKNEYEHVIASCYFSMSINIDTAIMVLYSYNEGFHSYDLYRSNQHYNNYKYTNVFKIRRNITVC